MNSQASDNYRLTRLRRVPSDSIRGDYAIVRVDTPRLAHFNRSRDGLGYHKVEHFSILYKHRIVGAITNEHYEGNWRIIKLDGSQVGPGSFSQVIPFSEIMEFIFNQEESFWKDMSTEVYLVETAMGFTYYLTTEAGYWHLSHYPSYVPSHIKVPEDMNVLLESIKSQAPHLHPVGDEAASVRKVKLIKQKLDI